MCLKTFVQACQSPTSGSNLLAGCDNSDGVTQTPFVAFKGRTQRRGNIGLHFVQQK